MPYSIRTIRTGSFQVAFGYAIDDGGDEPIAWFGDREHASAFIGTLEELDRFHKDKDILCRSLHRNFYDARYVVITPGFHKSLVRSVLADPTAGPAALQLPDGAKGTFMGREIRTAEFSVDNKIAEIHLIDGSVAEVWRGES